MDEVESIHGPRDTCESFLPLFRKRGKRCVDMCNDIAKIPAVDTVHIRGAQSRRFFSCKQKQVKYTIILWRMNRVFTQLDSQVVLTVFFNFLRTLLQL